jgi:NAD kinase
MMKKAEQVVVVTRRTRFDSVKAKFGTAGQARFVLRQQQKQAKMTLKSLVISDAEADSMYENLAHEDTTYDGIIEQLKNELNVGLPVTFIDRELLPTYDFRWAAAVIAVGQDGLVANTAKYIHDAPLIGINPDPKLYDGVLLPFGPHQAQSILKRTLEKRTKSTAVTLAEATLDNGQTLLAFNDFFIGQS